MACRGCSSDGCNCSVTGDGVAISVTGSGTPVTDPYVVSIDVDDALGSITVDDATDCSLLDTPRVPVVLGTGITRLVPLPCYDSFDSPVSGLAFAFTWNGSTTEEDPGAGYVALNNVLASATALHVSETDINGTDIADWLDAIDGGFVRLYSRSDLTDWAIYEVGAVTSPDTGMRKIVLTYVDHSGGPFSDVVPGDIVMDYTPRGATGATGATGGFDSVQVIDTEAASFTLDLTQAGKYIRCTSGSAMDVTVPLNATVAFAIGTHIDVVQAGAGLVSFVATGGVTINATGLDMASQWAAATLIKVGTDEWDLIGNLA